MRFFTVLILSSVLLLPACATKSNKVVSQEQGTPVQTPAIEQVEEEKQAPAQEQPSSDETQEEPQTFTQSLIKFFSPSPSPSQKEKLNQEQTKAEQKTTQKQTNKKKIRRNSYLIKEKKSIRKRN